MAEVARLEGVSVVRDGRPILEVESLVFDGAERWAVLGPNGSGKSTLLALLAGRLWPTTGAVHLLGEQVGRVDLRALRARLGIHAASLAKQLRPTLSVADAVVTGLDGALETWWSNYRPEDQRAAQRLLDELGVGHLAGSQVGLVSEGERARILLARVLIAEPDLLLLDEPAAGLDLGAREDLLERLGRRFLDPGQPGAVLVTHHLEELPSGLTHALLLREGRVAAAGPIDEVLVSERVSQAFGLPIEVLALGRGRFAARAQQR
jgi:iron complex transport system ATP-binding protein